ncbi:MAG: HNH endonuclease, partial [Candidatus Binatia bacterium]
VEGSAAEPPPLGPRLERVQMRVDGEATGADRLIEFWGPASVVSTLERLAIAWSEPKEAYWRGLVRLLAAVAARWQVEERHSGIPAHERRILERDGYRCIVPACSSRRNLQVHHIIFRSAGGGEEDWNRGALCAGHHLQCVHRFDVVASGRAPDAIDWVLGAAGPDAPLMRLHGETYADT